MVVPPKQHIVHPVHPDELKGGPAEFMRARSLSRERERAERKFSATFCKQKRLGGKRRRFIFSGLLGEEN